MTHNRRTATRKRVSGNEAGVIYIVKQGDTLSAIAVRHGVTVTALLAANPGIKNAGRIRVGQRIVIAERKFSGPTSGGGQRPTRGRDEAGPAGTQPGLMSDISETYDRLFDQLTDWLKSWGSSPLRFDRKTFFNGYRARFGKLSQQQVDGLESLLGGFEGDPDMKDIQHVAYMLATVKHETADTFQPIVERGPKDYFNRYDPVLADTAARRARAKKMGNTEEGDGYRYRGRGYVQLTWKNNYEKLGTVLGADLVGNPDLVLEADMAYRIMSYGMRNGVFTSHKIGRHIADGIADYYNARQVINGHDKATLIEGYAKKFETMLNEATRP